MALVDLAKLKEFEKVDTLVVKDHRERWGASTSGGLSSFLK